MKKFLLIAAVLGSAFAVNAQNEFAPQKGDFSTEIQFAPFSGNEIFSNGGILQGRYFFTNKDACVLEVGLRGTNNKEVNGDDSSVYTRDYEGRFQINLGYQRHFYQYKRVDLYAGGKIGYYHDFQASKESFGNNTWNWNNKGTGNGFQLYVTTGIDFYVYKGLYVGAEINVGFQDTILMGYTEKSCVDGALTEIKTKKGGHDFSGGVDVQPLVRLGWTF